MISTPEGSGIDHPRIVGAVRSPWFSDVGDTSRGTLVPSAGLLERHRAELVGTQELMYLNTLVRLEGGTMRCPPSGSGWPRSAAATTSSSSTWPTAPTTYADVARFEANALLTFAAAAGIAALFLVGQSVVRYVAGTTAELEVLRAIGMRRRSLRAMAALGPSLAGVVGAVGALLRVPRLRPLPGRHRRAH